MASSTTNAMHCTSAKHSSHVVCHSEQNVDVYHSYGGTYTCSVIDTSKIYIIGVVTGGCGGGEGE